jgi:hypothetical protein
MNRTLILALATVSLALPVRAEEPAMANWFAVGARNSNLYYNSDSSDKNYFHPKAFLSYTYRSAAMSPSFMGYYGVGINLEASKQYQLSKEDMGNVGNMQQFVEKTDYMNAHLLVGLWTPWTIKGMYWGPRITCTSFNTRVLTTTDTGQYVGATSQSLRTQVRYSIVLSDCQARKIKDLFSELEIGLAVDPLFGPRSQGNRAFFRGELHVPILGSETSAAIFSATVNKSRKVNSTDEVIVELGYLLRM